MKKTLSHFIGGVFLCNNAVDYSAEYWFQHSVSFVHETMAEHIDSLVHQMVLVQDREKEIFDPVHKKGVLEIAKRSLKTVELMIAGLEKPLQPEDQKKAEHGTRIILGIGDLKYCMAVLHLVATSTAGKPTDWMHLMRGLLDRKHGDVVWWNSRQPDDLLYGKMGEMYIKTAASFHRSVSR